MKNFSRRDFLKTSATAAGGLVLSSGMLSAQKKGGDKINIALVGMGAEGEVLLNSIVKLPYINVVAVCDIWQPRCEFAAMRIMRELKQAPARYTIKITPKDRLTPLVKRGRIGEIKGENYKDLIKNHAKELDAVVIATPDFWHAPMTVDFLKAGVKFRSDALSLYAPVHAELPQIEYGFSAIYLKTSNGHGAEPSVPVGRQPVGGFAVQHVFQSFCRRFVCPAVVPRRGVESSGEKLRHLSRVSCSYLFVLHSFLLLFTLIFAIRRHIPM